jgi:hypothetical protein
MAENVVPFSGITKLDLPPDRILNAAVGKLQSVVVIGYTKDGDEHFATSYADGGETLWLVERFKKALLDVPETFEGA